MDKLGKLLKAIHGCCLRFDDPIVNAYKTDRWLEKLDRQAEQRALENALEAKLLKDWAK